MKRPQVKHIKQGVTLFRVSGLGADTSITQLFVTSRPNTDNIIKQPRFNALVLNEFRPDGKKSKFGNPVRVFELGYFLGDCGFRFDANSQKRQRTNYFHRHGMKRGHALFFTLKDAVRYASAIASDALQIQMRKDFLTSLDCGYPMEDCHSDAYN